MPAASEITEAKIALIQWISTIDDPEVIGRISELRDHEEQISWKELSPETRESISKGLADADQGRLLPHSEARNIYKKWL